MAISEKIQWTLDDHKLILQGILDYTTVPNLWQQRQRWLKPTLEKLYIDIHGLKRIDSAGLALLLQFTEIAKKKQIPCQMIGMTDELFSLMTIYHLQPIMNAYLKSTTD